MQIISNNKSFIKKIIIIKKKLKQLGNTEWVLNSEPSV